MRCEDKTLQEQFADAAGRQALNRPPESGGLLPPHVYEKGPPIVPHVQPEPLAPPAEDYFCLMGCCFGVLSEQLGNNSTDWPIDAPLPLRSEMLWVLQFRALIMPELHCKVHFDCLAGLTLDLGHVKAHAGDPWNELSDLVAKEAAYGAVVSAGHLVMFAVSFRNSI